MIYIFRCRNCGRLLEYDLPVSAEKPGTCSCGGKLQRKFTAPAVIYRSSGFTGMDKRLTPVNPIDYNPAEDHPDDLKGYSIG